MEKDTCCQFWIDVGGTFTDCLGLFPDGDITYHKLLSTGVIKGSVGQGSTPDCIYDPLRTEDPDDFYQNFSLLMDGQEVLVEGFKEGKLYLAKSIKLGNSYELRNGDEAPVLGIKYLLAKKGYELNGIDVRLGTTRGTNALLENKGARTAFITTKGFEDVLCIGYQSRPKLFELNIRKPKELYESVLEIDERQDANGNILREPDWAKVKEQLQQLLDEGIDSLAVCLLFSYKDPEHEKKIAAIASELGFTHISLSSEVVPLQKMVPRGDTTVIDAYLTPVIRDYVNTIESCLPNSKLKIMTSSGGLVDAHHFVGKDSILSGPAGGVVGYSKIAHLAGYKKVIGFDMGGTSTDVSRFDGQFDYCFEKEIQGTHFFSPMLAIETVASGGGSICWYDGELPRVGPKSAGADPGPACYGKGGPLTVTDMNVFLGHLLPENFPFTLDFAAIEEKLNELVVQIPAVHSAEELAEGFLEIANSKMAGAIRKISVEKGYDPREYALVSFGGAASQHACAIAEELGMKTVIISPFASILSALGMGVADIKRFLSRYMKPEDDLSEAFEEMEAQVKQEVLAEGAIEVEDPKRLYEVRYQGQDWTITFAKPKDCLLQEAFEKLHLQYYGFIYEERPIEICAIRVECVGKMATWNPVKQEGKKQDAKPFMQKSSYFQGKKEEIPCYRPKPFEELEGPALISTSFSSVLLHLSWKACVDGYGNLILKTEKKREKKQMTKAFDPINLELFNHKFKGIAEEMGVVLQKTALSVNVKERNDFSCALFTPEGDLVVNAPHIPVHLGGMSECIKCLLEDVPKMQAGDIFITNDPYRGGSHLPDVTVITPVFNSENKLIFFTASRAHHAEIGGITPGSMPSFAKNLAEEGVLLKTLRFIPGKDEEKLKSLLTKARYPSRAAEDNVADIAAQIAANHIGLKKLLELSDTYGLEIVHGYMRFIQEAAKRKMKQALKKIPQGSYCFSDYLDNDSKISVKIDIDHQKGAFVDFSGTSGVDKGNFNANPSIVKSALLYCFRCLIGEDIPLNSGILEVIDLHLPKDCLLNPPIHSDPEKCAAVVAGNVETSQRLVDVIFGALNVVAASQGTMNNVLFGNEHFSYYETLAGGAGAGPDFAGASGVHTHMTNTRLTDPEVFESRFPVRLLRFSLRKGSGGKGVFCGGDGVIREIEFLEEVTLSLLTSRRRYAPYGLNGGGEGMCGENLLQVNDEVYVLNFADRVNAKPGTILIIKTPGGGGAG